MGCFCNGAPGTLHGTDGSQGHAVADLLTAHCRARLARLVMRSPSASRPKSSARPTTGRASSEKELGKEGGSVEQPAERRRACAQAHLAPGHPQEAHSGGRGQPRAFSGRALLGTSAWWWVALHPVNLEQSTEAVP